MSATSGTPPAVGKGLDGSTSNCTPWMVSLEVRWRKAAPGSTLTSDGSGQRTYLFSLPSPGPVVAARRAEPPTMAAASLASPRAFSPQAPVTT